MIVGHPDGLILIETVTPEDYLLGIQEVPFSWELEALRTQAVAARTYLAWTLSRGRAGAGDLYGFDICASSACQVYGGLDLVEGPGGSRWEEAVSSTEREVLLYEGSPAQTLYSSTSSGQTSSIQDVYQNREPLPYLQGVESPGESSPFVSWSFDVPVGAVQKAVALSGELPGTLIDITVTPQPAGVGPWMVRLSSESAAVRMTTWDFRGIMNRYGPDVAPDLLPAALSEDRRYPQVILSPTYTVERRLTYVPFEGDWDLQRRLIYRFDGGGWGHTVGMSQYGAQAMAEAGATYDEILSHYYTGLQPQEAGQALPDEISVGLIWAEGELTIEPNGPVTVLADGEEVAADALGSWSFDSDGSDVVVEPPIGLGLPLAMRDVPGLVSADAGQAPVIPFTISGAAEVRLVVFDGPAVVAVTDWVIREAGSQVIVWDGVVGGGVVGPGLYRVLVEARSADGHDYMFTTVGVGGVPNPS